ncbi:MAG TPA: PAS domain S-box protein, partial [Candidatus Acidoferrum sp.]
GAELRALKLLALDSTANPIVISKRDGTIIWANEAFELLSGYSVEEVLGQNTRLLKSGQHSPSFYKTLWNTILSGQRWQGELVNRRKDGSFYQEEMTITPVKSDNGEISHFIAIKIDITERKRAEARICLLAEAVENSGELICITNSDGIVLVVNQALLQATGYKESEVIGTLFGSSLISPNNPPNFSEELLARTLADGQWRGECLSSRKDRTDFPTYLSTGQIKDSQGLLIGLYGISQDITERKRADATNQTLASALDLAHDSIMYLDAVGRIMYWNNGAANTYGWSREEAVGQIIHELLQTIFPKPLLEIKAELSAQGKWEGELVQCCKNGAKVILSSRWVTHRDISGHVDGTLEINRDVTERNRLEIQLRRNKDRLDLALEVAGMGEWELDLKNLTATRSLLHDQIFGYPSLVPEWNYAKFLDHVLPQHRSEIDEKFRASQATGIWDFETQIRRVDGEVRWIWTRGRRWLDATGQATRMLGTVIDITERKREEGLSRALFDIADAADHVQSLDDLYKCIHEIIRTIIPTDSFYIAFYDEASDELQFPYYVDEVDLPLTRRKSSKGRTDYVLRTGTPLLLDWSSNRDLERRGDIVAAGKPTATWMGVPLKIDNTTIGVMAAQHYTNPTAFDGTHLKIFENIASHVAKVIARKRAEEERRVAEERFYKAFHASPIGICISTMEDGVILEVNEAFANLVQYESEELVGKTTLGLDLYVQPEDRMQLLKLLHSEVPLRDFKFDLRTKSKKILSIHAAAESLEVHGVACILVLLRDSTEQEVLERQLRQAQRMEAVGSLS